MTQPTSLQIIDQGRVRHLDFPTHGEAQAWADSHPATFVVNIYPTPQEGPAVTVHHPTPEQLTAAVLVIRDHLALADSDHEDTVVRAFEAAGLMRECEDCRAAWAYPDDAPGQPCENCGHVTPTTDTTEEH